MTDASFTRHESSSSEGRPESQNSETDTSERNQSFENADAIYPFLVHSRDSVSNGDPPEVDNGKLARQKRRRTSPEDQATLETEYKKNPKPDKAARLVIVQKVELGEKEVQIWFQNRRQNTRRKTRPLLPHEIAAFGLGGMAVLSSDSATLFGSSQGSEQSPPSSQFTIQRETSGISDGDVTPSHKFINQGGSKTAAASGTTIDPALRTENVTMDFSQPPQVVLDPNARPFQFATSGSQMATTPRDYISNRRIASLPHFSTPASSQGLPFSTPPMHALSPPSSCPEKLLTGSTSTTNLSQVRLSMSLDGKAELVSALKSPPYKESRPTSAHSTIPQRRSIGLSRSQSAFQFAPHRRNPEDTSPSFLPRMPSGRSRDARTWAFCCDSDARDDRDALTTQAENESNGSAVAAISLLRSTSTSALKPNSNKRNAPSQQKRKDEVHGKKPKLGRAQSSLARLQTEEKTSLKVSEKRDISSASYELHKSPSGDSDKENWIPLESGGNPQRRRQLPSGARISSQNRRRALEENAMHGRPSKKAKVPTEIFEDVDVSPEVDLEVEKFMRGEVSPSKKGDLDCIQGLLSLSQGNWR